MQKNILILGLGTFGYAVACHLGKHNPEQIFFASEKNTETFEYIAKTRRQPYFFQEHTLPENIVLKADIIEILPEIDIILSIIPCQFVAPSFAEIKDLLKPGVVILNLAKGIDNTSPETISEKLDSLLNPNFQKNSNSHLNFGSHANSNSHLNSLSFQEKEATKNYTYAYISGGMIAQELIDGSLLGADIVTQNSEVGAFLTKLFASENLHINLKIEHPKNTELAAALKNIVALILGYYEGQGAEASTLGYYFTKLLGEIQGVIEILDSYSTSKSPQDTSHNSPLPGEMKLQNNEVCPLSSQERGRERSCAETLNFASYALSGDLIATCFGNSRNRLLGNMLGKGMSIEDALAELKAQKKIAEGYETLKGMKKIIVGKEGFEETEKFCEKFL